MRCSRCLRSALPNGVSLTGPDRLHGGAFVSWESRGAKINPGPTRRRMPWTVAKEIVPTTVYLNRDKAIVEGVEMFKGIQRVDMLEPLQAIKAICAKRDLLTSTGLTLYQLAVHLKHDGRGQRFYRDDWRDGTCDKHVTLSRISFEREAANGGTAWGYMTFHGETTLHPIEIPNADIPGWHVEYDESRAVGPDGIVEPPPSIGTEVPVNPKEYKLKAYPYYDAPAPKEWVERLLKERGAIPDVAPRPKKDEADTSSDNSKEVPAA